MNKGTSTTIAAVMAAALFSMCNPPAEQHPTEEHDHSAQVDTAQYISKVFQVTGAVKRTLALTVDSLRAMDVDTIADFKVVCQSGDTVKENFTSTGVLLKDILDKAEIAQANHKDRNFYIVARATDGYKATFSWAEIYNNPTGENVYVLFEKNGEPIGTKGDFILICRNDIKTGPRHVYWLKSIEVNRVD
ncbi:MAG TPA: molybdopterin-dependent oxidoreductase [Flavobacteriales bacterium]|nr:molybdopterin-dependent oxidoreductase [Flavobacteriales bacterium]